MQPKRLALQFSLAALMLIITFSAIGMGVWRRFQEYKAFHHNLMNQAEHIRPSPGPATFNNFLLGKAYNVDHLSFRNNQSFGDDEMAALLPLRKLRRLSLQSTSISNNVAETLTQFPELRVLSVAGTNVGDTFADQISELSQLEELYVSTTTISDEGAVSIAKLGGLRVLTLSETSVSNVGLREVAKLQNLELLSLQLREMPAHWLAELEPLKNLRSLKLDAVDELGVQELAKLERLEELQVLGAGYHGNIECLGALSGLKQLQIRVSTDAPGEPLPTMPKLEFLDLKSEVGFSIINQPSLKRLEYRMRRLSRDVEISNSPALDYLQLEQESSSGTNVETVVQLSDLPQLVWLKVVCCSLKISGRLDKLEILDVYDQGPKGSFSPPGAFTLKVEEKLPALGLVGVPKGYQRDESTEKIIRYRRHRK